MCVLRNARRAITSAAAAVATIAAAILCRAKFDIISKIKLCWFDRYSGKGLILFFFSYKHTRFIDW